MRFSKKSRDCNQSPIRKFYPYAVEAGNRGVKIYQLNIGQPDIETPKAYFETVRKFDGTVLTYAPSSGEQPLREAVAKYYCNLGVEIHPKDVLVTTGGSEALLITLQCILDEGDEVIVPEPFYPNYRTFIIAAGGTIRPLSTSVADGYAYADPEKLERLVNEKTRAIMFTNPGNPTGYVLSMREMQVLADFAKKHDLFIIADEVYREFVYAGEPLMSMGMINEVADRTILIDSVSKRFSACGARIGMLISKNEELMQHALKFCQARLSVSTLDQEASAALYDLNATYFEPVREEYRNRRDTLVAGLQAIPGVVCKQPAGAFYLMAKLPVENAEEFLIWMLTSFEDDGETLMFAPGESFYATQGRGVDEARFAYVLNCRDIRRATDILAKALAAYNSRFRSPFIAACRPAVAVRNGGCV